MPLPTISMATLHTRPALSRLLISALLIGLASGCSNNSNNTGVINSAQAETGTVPIATNSDPDVIKALQANLAASGIEETILSAVPTAMEGTYWVTAEGLPSFFTDKAGQHIIQGQIIAIGAKAPVDISAALVASTAQQALKAIDKKDMVIYPAKGATQSVVYAFTDADCGYCRKLHSEIDDITARGVEVRYLAWPRSPQSVPKMEAVWCSKDRKAAMDQAKAGVEIQAPSCVNPVQAHMALGAKLGVRGTPAIFTEAGQQIGGYLPAAQLAEAANDSQ